MIKNEQKIPLPKLDDLFTTEEERIDAKLEKVVYINLNDIDDFPEHPFKVTVNEELEQLRDSIIEKGVLVPTLVRQKENGRYEMISGHRRKKASELAGNNTIPCIVRDLSDNDATIIMVDSNLQREHILPSERAFAYKMKIEAVKKQGSRTDLTFSQVGKRLNVYEELAQEIGKSKSSIHRFIRLTELIKPLLDMVDDETIAFNPAVEMSYLSKEEQKWLLDSINCNLATPSLSQAQEMKRLSQDNKLTKDKINKLLSEEKPNQIEKLKLEMKSLESKMPSGVPVTKYKEYIYKALDYYNKYLQRLKDKER